MNNAQRENLKAKIEADLELLEKESWNVEVQENLQKVAKQLRTISLEGYDD